jgi:hypothetical protein
MKRNTYTIPDSIREVGLEVHSNKTKYMFMARHQIAGQNHNIQIANKSLKM